LKILSVIEKAALDRLVDHAKRDNEQGAAVANFLLSWWNADKLGKFNIAEVWALEPDTARDMATVFHFLANSGGVYPDELGYEYDFRKIIELHRVV
jgi:hypothetical protein